MNRTDIINAIAKKIDAKSYLEIGVDNGHNFNSIKCNHKVGVDPNPQISNVLAMTSDKFFAQNEDNFDLIFIDGLHIHDQVYRDIVHALNVLNPNGYIICHDMNPISEERQKTPWTGGDWNGDCWKAFVDLRRERVDLEMMTINTDEGVSIIRRGFQVPLHLEGKLTYKDLEKNRNEWLNLKSESEFRIMFMQSNLQHLVENFALDPNNPEKNFEIALEYDEIGQTASAVSFYIRTAERTKDDLLKYECLIRAAMCFEKQGTRKFSVKGLLQHAIAVQPKRPEGYYLLSLFYENEINSDGRWFDSYLTSSIGLDVSEFEKLKPLRTKLNYPGKYGLLFQKAHTAWWCGLCEDSKSMFLDLHANYDMDEKIREVVYNNLIMLNAFSSKSLNLYSKEKYEKFVMKFDGLEGMKQNYSEAYQDLFALAVSNGKRNGTYVEIGSGHPSYGNNTYLLEKEFGWNGVSLDISEEFVKAHNEQRSHTCLLKDATATNYESLFVAQGFDDVIDYLQVDCDPPSVSFKALLSIPFEKYKFRAITFEHDHYADPTGGYREKARKYLQSLGYVLFASDISPDDNRPYEDWFVHPELFDISKIRNYEGTKNAEKFMLGVKK
jgi:hypothetical protein